MFPETTEDASKEASSDIHSSKPRATMLTEQTETTSTIKSSSSEQHTTSESNHSNQDMVTITSGKTFGLSGDLPKVNETSTSAKNESIDTTMPSMICNNFFFASRILS